ncbi:MAG: stage III sporulation protein AB [Clostridia bacterium]|nr:stage III sporulation protein AB [Clostridia bacterium]
MSNETYLLKQYGQAVQFLPPRLRSYAMNMSDEIKKRAREFRLREGTLLTVLTDECEVPVNSDAKVRHEELATIVDIATGGSVHSSSEQIKSGYLTVRGGHRIGLCGSGVYKNGEVSFIKNISSVAIRIAKEFIGVSDGIYEQLTVNKGFESTIIISPPGCGKTTMLRDLIRNLSNGKYAYRVSVADERNEIAGKHRGVPQFDLGQHTDVMEGMSKSYATMVMLRAMTPEILAVDEITVKEDIAAIESAANCGVALLATAHGAGVNSLFDRMLYKQLQNLGIFKRAVVLGIKNGNYTAKVEAL